MQIIFILAVLLGAAFLFFYGVWLIVKEGKL